MANLSGQTIADATTLARYVNLYNKQIQDQINMEDIMFNRIGEDKEGKFVGANYIIKLRTGYNWRSFSSRRQDASSMPTAGAGEFVEASVSTAHHYFQFAVDLVSQARSQGGGAIGPDEIKLALKEGASVGAWNLNRMFYGNVYGRLAELYAATTGTDQPVKKSPGVIWVRHNMYLDGYDGTTQRVNSIRVVSTTEGTDYDTITFASSQTTTMAAASYFFLEDSYHASGTEMNGLQAIASTSSTLHGVDPATYPDWTAYVNSNSGTYRDFTITLLKRSLSKMRRGLPAGCTINQILSNDGQLDNYYDIIAAQQQFDGSKMKADYGLTDLSFMNIKWTIDPFCELNKIYLYDSDKIKKIVTRPFTIENRDGVTLHLTSTSDSLWGRMTGYINMLCKIRKAIGMISDLNEPAN